MDGALVTASTGVMMMNSLLAKLSALIEGEYKLLTGVKSDIRFLRDELTTMNAFLENVAAIEKLDPLVKDWRDKIRELSYDMEDCIDRFMHKLNSGGAKVSVVHRTADKIKKLWSRHQIANHIQELKARVMEEAERHLRYKFDEYVSKADRVEIDPRLPALYVEEEKLVGIDGPMEKIMEWLAKQDESTQQLKVVSFVGFGGLGKTTLANQVYDKVKGQFQCTAFTPVSRNPNVRKILADMLEEIGSNADTSSDDERQLINKLRAYLQDKRYFVIVDDVWSKSAWELVKSALPDNNNSSRIITTTRNADVAKSCCSGPCDYIYNLQPLCEQDSQKIFFKRLFDSELFCPPHLEEVFHVIIKKCCGLPLAVITIAGMLARRSYTKEQWEQVHNSFGSAFSSEGMSEILLLSYHDLPCHLKTCLLYFSMFPEDFRIEKEELIWRWAAEGFIIEEKAQTLEHTGENYFNDLINRSLIQPIGIMYDGRARFCRVHDMVLDLIISLSTEQNFITIVEGQAYKCSSNNIRRLSVLSNCVGNEVMHEIMDKCLKIRSLVIINGLDKQTLHLSKLRYLRVLVLEDGDGQLGNQQIKYIGSFIQLKYLKIRSRGVTMLPEQIGDLQNLQTLDTRGSINVEKLPPTIGRFQNLVRLLVPRYPVVHVPDEIGDLQNLKVLSFVRSYNSTNFVGQLRRLTNVRVLGIALHGSDKLGDHDMGRYQEALESSLTLLVKQRLKSLKIDFGNYPAADELMDSLCSDAQCLQILVCCDLISRLPRRMASLVNLSHLRIGVKEIKQEDICILGGMPTLLYVSLVSREAPSERHTICRQQFCCLKEFVLMTLGDGGLRMVLQWTGRLH